MKCKWRETGLLRALLAFLKTKNWQEKATGNDNEENMADVRAAVQNHFSYSTGVQRCVHGHHSR
jgi:hypothetical protein